MEAKFSNRVKEVITLSREEALRLGHDYIGTEHLLLGMIREGEGVAVGVLKKLGVPLDDLRSEIEKISLSCAIDRGGVDLVKVAVVVTDFDGRPVRGAWAAWS